MVELICSPNKNKMRILYNYKIFDKSTMKKNIAFVENMEIASNPFKVQQIY